MVGGHTRYRRRFHPAPTRCSAHPEGGFREWKEVKPSRTAGQSKRLYGPDATACRASSRLILAGRDEGAPAVHRDDEPLLPQLSHSPTYCHPGYAVLLGQV